MARLTYEAIENRLSPRGLHLEGEYLGRSHRAQFLCDNGHTWKTTASLVFSGSGCPKCAAEDKKLSPGVINTRLMGRNIEMIGEYTGALSKTKFRCGCCSNEWLSTPGNILSGKGCSVCAKHGFNPNKPAWTYVFTRADYLKYGITNNLGQRLEQHKRHGDLVLVYNQYHEDGKLAVDWENNIKKTYGGRYSRRELCPDGWTETLSIDLFETFIISLHQ